MGIFSTCHGQASPKKAGGPETVQLDSTKPMNLLDEQTKTFDQIFTMAGASDEDNPTGGATNYLDMINNMEGSEELKQQIRELYDLYDTSLDPTKKAELKIKVAKMLEEAMAKSQNDPIK